MHVPTTLFSVSLPTKQIILLKALEWKSPSSTGVLPDELDYFDPDVIQKYMNMTRGAVKEDTSRSKLVQ